MNSPIKLAILLAPGAIAIYLCVVFLPRMESDLLTNTTTETVFRVPLNSPMVDRDPIDLVVLEEWDVYRAILDKLWVTESGTGDFEGVAAKSWIFDRPNSQLRFTLRDNLKFSDGTTISSEAVAFSIKRKILLTYDKNPLLPSCLGIARSDLEGFPLKQIPQIEVTGAKTLTLHLTKCSSLILEELAGTNYSIVSQDTVGPDWRVKQRTPTSGAFTYDIVNGTFTLRPNLNNWRVGSRSIRPFRVEIIPMQTFSAQSQAGNVDPQVAFLKSSDPSLTAALEREGFHSVHSLPSDSLLLALRRDGSGKISKFAQRVIKDVNVRLDRSRLIPPSMASTYTGSDMLFPKDFNCDPPPDTKPELSNEEQLNLFSVEILLTSFMDSDYAGLLNIVADALSGLGYKIHRIKKAEVNAYLAQRNEPRIVVMELIRQHLSLRLTEVINLMVTQLNTIIDDDNVVKSELSRVHSSQESGSPTSTRLLCKVLHQYNHAPIAHRRETFLARDPKYLTVFSSATANMHLEKLLEIMGQ